MSRELEPLLIQQCDFDSVSQVALHCNWEQLCVYIREQQNLSLLPKIGHCLFEKIVSYVQGYYQCNECDQENRSVVKHLFEGGRYTACDGTTKVHFGLKRSLIHWAYGAYIYRHGIVDTPFGVVQKMNQDSVPIDLKDLAKVNVENRNNAEFYFQMTKDYLCSVKDCEALKDCKICDCISDCKCDHCKNKHKSTLQKRNVQFQNISKWDA